MRQPNSRTLFLMSTGLLTGVLLAGCGGSSDSNDGPTFPVGAIMLPAENLTQAAKEAFINAESGDVIVFPEGRFELADTLTFDGDPDGDGSSLQGITILGYGKDDTILDFAASAGGDGLFIQNGVDVTIKNLGVYEAANNAIKLKDTNGIHIKSVATVWEGELNEENGAYGLYPVECENILIEDSYVRGSADAGVYVGQSSHIVVRRNTAVENVAGIEIENSVNADVYDNVATGNTGGILVFDLPIGNERYGSTVRVFDNDITANNTTNFANSSDFAAGVHIVPPGTGVILLSSSDVEVYHNTIADHDTTSVTITSYFIADEQLNYANPTYTDIIDDGWEPVPRNVSIHDNQISNSGTNPRGDLIEDIILGYQAGGVTVPAILYDGIGELLANAGADSTTTGAPFAAEDAICARDNGGVSHGQIYLTDPTDPDAFDTTDPQNPVPAPQLLYEAAQAEILACDQPHGRLPASSATIAGQAYGCGSAETGDSSAASCNL